MGYKQHGWRNSPEGTDSTITGRWHKCGDTGEPSLGTGITGTAWFKLVVGPSGHLKQSLEVVIAVDGGSDGDTIFTLPDGYYDFADGQNIPASGHDSTGAYRAWYIDGSNGNVILGPLP